ncbi:MAG TPA: hypothetical protein VF868_15195 [Bacteroidia bacterium]|jgi:TFIIF-interacting CTD phosphatase-like protein
MNIPIFNAGTHKGLPKKRQFKKLVLNPELNDGAIHTEYSEWLETPSGDKIEETLLCYEENLEALAVWFNYVPPVGASMGQVILGAINAKLNAL